MDASSKRTRSDSAQTDNEDSPANKIYNILPPSSGNTSDFKSLMAHEMGEIQIAFSEALAKDPILVMKWNPLWLAIPGNIAGKSHPFNV